MNFIKNVEVKMTKDKGRGVFAKCDIPRGELIVVEYALAEVFLDADSLTTDHTISQAKIKGLADGCQFIANLKGVEALRLNYMYDGRD